MSGAVTRGAVTASTALCGILLHPAGHTRSPAMHNAAYAALGIDAVYLAFDVTPGELAAAIAGARALNVRQLAISIPHKEAVMAHLDRVDETARAIGAVNTVTRVGNALVGSNTDWLGVARALERETKLAGKTAVVLGAGGTARAALYALREHGARTIVLNRTPGKAEALARELGALRAGAPAELAEIPHDLLVNTTSVGLRADASPVAAEALRSDSVVLDAVYDPVETRLLRDARARGARTVSGKWMLIEQAREQLRLWTQREVEADVLSDAFDRASPT
ncbi:MAG TPA: shikimate dehydrogenase [Myxococcota bacterium]|nr:shikimate dehydrogenase [Myxococcota bacterium]